MSDGLDEFCGEAFWDYQLSVNTSTPDVTECFQHTLLVWLPCGFLWMFAPLQWYYVLSSKLLALPWRGLNLCKLVVLFLLLVDVLILLFYTVHEWRTSEHSTPTVYFVYPLILILTLLNMFLLTFLCQLRGIITSGVLFLTWCLFALAGFPEFFSRINKSYHQGADSHSVRFVLYMIYYQLVIIALFLSCFADRRASYSTVEATENECPEYQSSFLCQITFWWFNGMAMVGWKRPLEPKDLWSLNRTDTSEYLAPIWDKHWASAMRNYERRKHLLQEKLAADALKKGDASEKLLLEEPQEIDIDGLKGNQKQNMEKRGPNYQKQRDGAVTCVVKEDDVQVQVVGGKAGKSKKNKKEKKPKTHPSHPSIIWALFLCFKATTVSAVLFKLFADCLQFISPQILSLLIGFVERSQEPNWKGYFYTVLLFVNSQLYSFLLHQYFHRMFRVGMNVRSVLTSAVFKKALVLSNAARQQSKTTGEIVNLMSVDVQRLTDVTTYINMLWSSPLQIVLSVYFLWEQLGPAVLAGVGFMIVLIPLNGAVAKKLRDLNLAQMKHKDDRIKLMSEVLNGMKILKLYTWEPSFEKQLLDIREKELIVLRTSAYYGSFTTFLWTCAPFIVSVISFAVYVLASDDNILTPQKAFVSLALFNILRFPLSMLPMLVTFMVQANVSNNRLKAYLTSEEIDSDSVQFDAAAAQPVSIVDGVFAWGKEAVPTLTDVNLIIEPGSLVAVVGAVGSGKTSLLNAMLGEMDRKQGVVKLNGTVSYVPQQAFIQNATLRSNVLFSKGLDQAFYDRVVEACALRPDLEMLPGGDETEIGEKGITLSGGQKQRVSLARAVYQDADIYLLDDPLSAVDSHVGKHIFDHVISSEKGMLRKKTRILVTHGLGYLKYVDQIIVIRDGQISERGSFQDLLKNHGAFAEFLETYLQELNVEDIADADEAVDTIKEVIEELDKQQPGARQRLQSQLSSQSRVVASETSSDAKSDNASNGSHIDRQRSQESARRRSNSSEKESVSAARQVITRASPRRSKDADTAVVATSKPMSAMGKKLIQTETAETGQVKLSVWVTYLQAIGYWFTIIVMAQYAISNVFAVGSNIWLADWSNSETTKNNTTHQQTHMRLGVYAALGIGQGLFVFFGSLTMSYAMVLASTLLHKTLLENIMRSPMGFFDVTPLGRILNRLGKDVDVVDNTLPSNVRSWIACVFNVIATLLVVVVSTWMFIVIIIPLGILYYFVQRFYVSTSRQLKRLESVSRSPIYSHFQESIQGASSIRAYRAQDRFLQESWRRVDDNQMSYYPNVVSNRWLAIRLELVGNCVVLFASLLAVLGRDDTSPGMIGLSVSYALSVTQTLNWAVRMTSDVEANIVSVERIKEYSETPQEAPWQAAERPPKAWPAVGDIVVQDFGLRYRPDLELVLRGVTFKILGGEKVGIVGRTGAGKSSLTVALFRLIEPAKGKIVIDGLDITKMGLHDLRSKLTIIPQDPVLFSGTIRLNLDPFNMYADDELWAALDHSYLKDFVSSLTLKLEHIVAEGGDNLSVGQRQLICLARALLRKTKILVLDEATAAVDMETDDLIQKTIRNEFRECTVLTIAHRLNTIMDSTRVLVLDKGNVIEFDSPEALLKQKNSAFYGMAKDAGLV